MTRLISAATLALGGFIVALAGLAWLNVPVFG